MVSFNCTVSIAPTWSADDYDRSSIPVDPLSKNDIMQIIVLRQQFKQRTAYILNLSEQIMAVPHMLKTLPIC
jgi:hypothetical protein